MLRVDQFAVDRDVEDSAATLDQLGLLIESFLKFGHQTGGFGKVVSLAAILDSNLHEFFLFLNSRVWERKFGHASDVPCSNGFLSNRTGNAMSSKRLRQHASRSPLWRPAFREWWAWPTLHLCRCLARFWVYYGRLGQQLYCCPLRRSGSTTAGPTENRAITHWSPVNMFARIRTSLSQLLFRPGHPVNISGSSGGSVC